MDNPGEILRLCRLCLVKDQVNIPIFEEQGDIRQIFLKISSCLPVTVSRDDKLPKRICDGCSNKLDLLYEFWNTSANAEKTLLSWLGQAGVKDADETISAVAQQIAKPAEAQVKEETEPLEDGHAVVSHSQDAFDAQSFDEGTKDEAEAPPPKRARRTAAVKAQINITPESEDEDDVDSAEPLTKLEDESDESDGEDKDPSYTEVPGTSADDQAGPSGVGKDGVEAPNACNVCNKQFSTAELRNNHLKNVQAFVLMFCNGCGFVGSAADSHSHHDYLLFCAVCKQFLCEQFWAHKCLHKSRVQDLAAKSKRSCESCRNYLFTDLDATNHANCADGLQKCNFCLCCRKEFPDLDFHLKRFKPPLKNHCVKCSLNFDNRDQFKIHIYQAHLNIVQMPGFLKVLKRPNKTQKIISKVPCRFCKLKFSNNNLAISHERKQHGEELIECPLCFKQVKVDKMKGHRITHRTRKCYMNSPTKICNVCGIAVKNLSRHMTIHCNERKYMCSICCKDFKLAWDMRKHLLAHVGEAKHKCSVCGKAFKVAYNLKVHMRSHDSVKPFACLVCEKTFTTKQSRDIHLKIHDKMTYVK